MSRIGKKIITLPSDVTLIVADRDITVKGPKGTLQMTLHPAVGIEQNGQELQVTLAKPDLKGSGAIWGLMRSLVANMVTGGSQGFRKQLEINGIGFKAANQGKNLVLNVGFSHPVTYEAPEGIALSVEKNIITVEGIDRHMVGQAAAEIRGIKKPEPYKGKGIKYVDETIRRKAGKVVKAG